MSARYVQRVTRVLALAWAVAAAASCGDNGSALTQIVVVVDSDLRVPQELSQLSLQVDGAVSMPKATADLMRDGLPRSLGLVYSGGPLGPIDVSVDGLLAGRTVVTRKARVYFRKDKTVELRMPLMRACTGTAAPSCADSQTCDRGACTAATIAKLPTFDGSVEPFAGGAGGAGGSGAEAGAGGDSLAAGAGGQQDSGGAGSPSMDGGAGAPAAGGGGSGGSSQAGGGGSGGSPQAGGGADNQPPTCTISAPSDGDGSYQGDAITFAGSCNDPETGTRLLVLRWQSDRDGLLGTKGWFTRDNLSVGTHAISLCANDPQDAQLKGCASIEISVAALPDITATIQSVTQSGATPASFETTAAIDAQGAGGGVDPVELAWTDSLLGSLGTGAQVTLDNPPMGKHTLRLTATDARSRTANDSKTFTVLLPGHTQLVEPYSLVNAAVTNSGRVSVLAADDTSGFAFASPGVLYGFDLAPPSMSMPNVVKSFTPTSVRDMFLDAGTAVAYLATDAGLYECPYASGSIDGTMCTQYTVSDIDNLPSNDLRAVLIARFNATAYLIVGTNQGLFVAKASDPTNNGEKQLDVVINAMAFGNDMLWLATDDGLYACAASGTLQSCNQQTATGSPATQLTDVALGSSVVWVSSQSGIGRFTPASHTWSTWHAATVTSQNVQPSLASNDARALVVARDVDIHGVTRDVIWIATAAGVSRFDPTLPSFTNFTTDDGLPSNDVDAVALTPAGNKLFGGAQGVALYIGP